MSRSVVERLFVWDKSNRSPRQENFGRPVVDRPAISTLILLFFLYLVSDHYTLGTYAERYIYSTKKVKEISENHATLEHQSKQLLNFYLFV